MKLKELQHNFIRYLQGKSYSSKLFNEIQSDSITDSLQIYKNNSFFSLKEALDNQYKSLNKYLGDSQFNEISNSCIKNHPSKSGNLDDYSRIFLDFFLENTKDRTAKDIAYLDFQYWSIYIAPDDISKTAEEFAAIPQDHYNKTILKTSHAIRLFQIQNSKSLKIWHTLFYDQDLHYDKRTNFILGSRYHLDSFFEYITESEFCFLNQILLGKNLEKVFEAMLTLKEENNFSQYLTRFIHKKIITGFTIN